MVMIVERTQQRQISRAVERSSTVALHEVSRRQSPLPIEVHLPWTAPHPQAGQHGFQSLEAMAQVWLLHGGDPTQLPKVNFDQSMAIAIFAGEGCFREIPSIDRVKFTTDEVLVYVSHFIRPWSTLNPMAVIQVPRLDLPIRFVAVI